MGSEERKNLYQAMLKAQAAIEPVTKDASNPHFKSTYASLGAVMEACKGPLQDNGLLLIQSSSGAMTDEHGRSFVRVSTSIVHAESGEALDSSLDIPLQRPDAQAVGSAITYGRRYAITAILGMTMEDDDGNRASQGGNGQGSNGRRLDNYPGSQGGAPRERTAAQAAFDDFQFILVNDFRNDGDRFSQALSNYFGRRIGGTRDLNEQEIRRFVQDWKNRDRS